AIVFILISGPIGLTAAYLTYFERKVIAFIQSRIGPNRVGPQGLLQPIADLVKMLQKEDIIPLKADAFLFRLAPYIVFVSTFLAMVIVPLGRGLVAGDLNVGLLYLIGVSSLASIGIFMAGWSSNNKFSLYGAIRSIAQLVSYEIPQVFALLAVATLAGSMRVSEVVNAQNSITLYFMDKSFQAPFWFIVPQFLGFIIFLITGIAETHRTPFDLPEAESELVAGFTTEYSGIRFGLFFAAEYMNVVLVSIFISCFYLGGWLPPSPLYETAEAAKAAGHPLMSLQTFPIWLSMLILAAKTSMAIFIIFWIRATLPRFRVDQLMDFAWKVLIPLSIFNLLLAALEVMWIA
ncbi:MAG: NADH-quinone oxidoreductase subunit NuoH, partial [bacterium]